MQNQSVENVLVEDTNIYAAVVVMSKRARQITDQQKMALDMERTVVPVPENKENEDFDEVEIDREALLREHKKLPKPTHVAIEDMLNKKIKYEFTSPNQPGSIQ